MRLFVLLLLWLSYASVNLNRSIVALLYSPLSSVIIEFVTWIGALIAEMDAPQFKEFAKEMVDYVSNYLENIRDRSVKVLLNLEYGSKTLNIV